MKKLVRKLRWLTFATLCLCAPLTEAQTKKNTPLTPPNIVILLADDLGYGDLGCYGHPQIRTPYLDILAKEGLRLTSYYSGAPVCSPSRAALLTGRIPQRDGIGDWIPENSGIFLPKETATLAKELQRANYATAMMGKWHLNSKMDGSEPTPGEHGFQYWFATQNNALPTHENPVNFFRNGQPVGPLKGYSSTLIVDEALEWLKQRKADQPFFLYVPFHAPHELVASASTFFLEYAKGRSADEAQYFGNVAQLDYEIGRLLQMLDQLKVAENTLVIFASDNGPETLNRYKTATRSYGTAGQLNGKKLRGMKLHLYEGGLRVPAILRWPAVIKPGRVSDAPVSAMDVMPTLRALVGLSEPELPLDGESIAALLQSEKHLRQRPIYWQYDQAIKSQTDKFLPKMALRAGDFKLLVASDFKTVELYNVKLDPAETNELSARELPRVRDMVEKVKLTHSQIAALKYAPKN
ncbi:MAG: sulfatase-like hydrolase/transferase [Acidobacteria bacterium]|nr:sulfatase-like hydrolase/transferase [Acidobacteriota bacterium]MBI3424716.1 sulfatase-like hydrolase/transferase [Acidobacteriota bacterium]